MKGKTMKSVKNDKTNDVVYPMLMERRGELVVLFYEHNRGVVASSNGFYPAGYHLNNWVMSDFTPYTGTVTLSN